MKQTFYSVFAAGLILIGAGSLNAQNRNAIKANHHSNLKVKKSPRQATLTPEFMGIPYLAPNQTVSSFNSGPRAFGPEVRIGQTLYDLQTNSSVPTRIMNHGNGSLSTIWTFSAEASTPWSDRGMAYHYFNGTAWVNNPNYESVSNILRVEPVRTGFGSLNRVTGVGDIIVAHQTAVTALQVSRNPSLDENQNWLSNVVNDMELIWPRMTVGGPDGKTVHVIGLTEPTGGNFTGTPYNGINGALLYNRSTDGGSTFDETMIQLPGVDSTIFGSFGGDSYAIDARGNTVAFVAGESLSRTMLWKSTDNGVTWDTTTILSFPFEPWDDQLTDFDGDGDVDSFLVGTTYAYDTTNIFTNTEYITEVDSTVLDSTLTYVFDENNVAIDSFYVFTYEYDTLVVDSIVTTTYEIDTTIVNPGTWQAEELTTSDGTYAILIDNNNKVHVWFGTMVILNDDDTDDQYSFFPTTSGILYWNEDFGTDSLILAADAVDDDLDGALDIVPNYSDAATSTPYNSGLTTFPSVGMDANGTIYLCYSGSKEGLDYRPVGPNYKHIYMTKSTDGGATWIAPVDLVGDENAGFDQFAEYAYCSMAKLVDNNVHLVYQRDGFPGSAVTIDDASVHPFNNENDIIYLSVPNNFEEVGVKKINAANFEANLMPNPANESTSLTFNLKNTVDVTITVNNLLGQNVETITANEAVAGSHNVTLNTENLPSGIYLVNIQAGNQTNTLKMVVKH